MAGRSLRSGPTQLVYGSVFPLRNSGMKLSAGHRSLENFFPTKTTTTENEQTSNEGLGPYAWAVCCGCVDLATASTGDKEKVNRKEEKEVKERKEERRPRSLA